MTATGCSLSSKDRRIALALGAAFIAALTALLAVPSVSAETDYDGEFDLYGYEVTMGLIQPSQVETVEWDFGNTPRTLDRWGDFRRSISLIL